MAIQVVKTNLLMLIQYLDTIFALRLHGVGFEPALRIQSR